MAGDLGARKGPMADINVTPLIDVVLVLLVVFMVITPMLQSGMPVDLPVASQAVTDKDAGQFIVVSVTRTKGVWVDQDMVKASTADPTLCDPDDLVARVNQQFADHPTTADGTTRNILIKGDKGLEYSKVRAVMDALAAHNMTTMLVAAGKEG